MISTKELPTSDNTCFSRNRGLVKTLFADLSNKRTAGDMNIADNYRQSLIWDDHCGFEMRPGAPLADLLAPWREAGVGYLSINVGFDPKPWHRTVENIAYLKSRLPTVAPYCEFVQTVADIDRVQANGGMAITFDIEGMNALNGHLEMVEFYYQLGVRHMLFAYNRNNLAGAGCHDDDIPLTDFGRQVVGEMNRVGMVVDCSHSGRQTTLDAMEASGDPVVFTHSNPKALCNHGRNIDDDQIKACAGTGGVIGINGINHFLGEAVASAAGVARHAAYVAELTGPEHVGISLDFDPDLGEGEDSENIHDLFQKHAEYWPEEAGYDETIASLDVRRMPDIAQELNKVGFSNDDITGILGGNFRRVAEQVWK
jgi:membrane dipeptidase